MNLTTEMWSIEGDAGDCYESECLKSAQDDEAFSTFKTNEYVGSIIENRPWSEASCHWEHAIHYWSGCVLHSDLFNRLNRIGLPPDSDYPKQAEIHSGLRLTGAMGSYIADLATLLYVFGDLDGLNIAELGGGYGGLAAVICSTFNPSSYTIFDVHGASKLQERYLAEADVRGVTCRSAVVENEPAYNLVISNYAFTELKLVYRGVLRKLLFQKASGGMISTHTLDKVEVKRSLRCLGHKVTLCADIPDWVGIHSDRQFVWGTK